MNASQLNQITTMPSLSIKAHREHYEFSMSIGRFFPTTRAQALRFIANGCHIDTLGAPDVDRIEDLLNKHGYVGEYKLTKSGTWARLINVTDLAIALKLEYK